MCRIGNKDRKRKLASIRKYNCDDIIRSYVGIYKVLQLLNECGDPSFLFENISSIRVLYKQPIGEV